MRILLIGGTRFIGRAAAEAMLAKGCEVAVFHRGNTPACPGVREFIGDRADLASHRDAFATFRPEVVVDMIPRHLAHAEQFLDVFRGIAQRHVAISSCDVYLAYGRLLGTEPGDPVETPVTEDSPLRGKLYPYSHDPPLPDDTPNKWMDEYDKIPAERDFLGDTDLPGCVLRLPMVYGPNDYQHRMWEYLKRMLDGRPTIPVSPDLAGWRTSRGYVSDIGSAIALAAMSEQSAGRVYNVSEPFFLTTVEWIEAIGSAVGWKGRAVLVVRPEDEDFRQDLTISSSRIREELGFTEVTARETAVRNTVEWESANPPPNFEPFDYKAEDKLVEEISD